MAADRFLLAVWFQERSSTDQSHSKSPLTATFSFAVHNRFAMEIEHVNLRPEPRILLDSISFSRPVSIIDGDRRVKNWERKVSAIENGLQRKLPHRRAVIRTLFFRFM